MGSGTLHETCNVDNRELAQPMSDETNTTDTVLNGKMISMLKVEHKHHKSENGSLICGEIDNCSDFNQCV